MPSMMLALKSLPLQVPAAPESTALVEPALKRRRFSADEVARELGAAGLHQAILSVLHSSEHAFGAGALLPQTSPGGLKRHCPQEAADCIWKRRRLPEHRPRLPVDIMPFCTQPVRLSINPITNSLTCNVTMQSCLQVARRPAGIAVDPLGTAFVISDLGFLVAELPHTWCVTIDLAGHGPAEIAKVAIDSKGTAYLLGYLDELLTTLPATKCVTQDVEIKMLNGGGSEKQKASADHHLEGIVFSPSTDVPSSEEFEDSDVSME